MRLPILRGALSTLLWPSFAKRVSRAHHEFKNEQVRSQTEEQKAAKRVESERWPERQIEILRNGWTQSLIRVVSVVVIGWCIGVLSDDYLLAFPSVVAGVQYLGVALLLWATLAKGGWDLGTMNGDTFAEVVDHAMFRFLHTIGSLLLVVGTTWSSSLQGAAV